MWLCRARMGPLAADPDICPPGQHAVPVEQAPLISTMTSDAVEDDAAEVGLHPAGLIAAKKDVGSNNHNAFQLMMSWVCVQTSLASP